MYKIGFINIWLKCGANIVRALRIGMSAPVLIHYDTPDCTLFVHLPGTNDVSLLRSDEENNTESVKL